MNLPILDRHHVVRKVQNGPEETICKTGKGFGARLIIDEEKVDKKCCSLIEKKHTKKPLFDLYLSIFEKIFIILTSN